MRKTMTIVCQSINFPNSTSAFRFYVFILFRKHNLMKIINSINTSLNNNPLKEPPSLTIMFSISSLKKFHCYFFITAWSCMSKRLDRLKLIYIHNFLSNTFEFLFTHLFSEYSSLMRKALVSPSVFRVLSPV